MSPKFKMHLMVFLQAAFDLDAKNYMQLYTIAGAVHFMRQCANTTKDKLELGHCERQLQMYEDLVKAATSE